ncbi:MAG: hypothetical protein J6Z33_03900, partial [Lachnospiraceae bacterium]|nr:hypothetical protein [Lachnospiraceae bacterium]
VAARRIGRLHVPVGTVLFDSFCVTFVMFLPSVGIMECCAFQAFGQNVPKRTVPVGTSLILQ